MSLSFADYYDAMMEDPEATQAWADYVKVYLAKGAILECACGSGKLAYNLACSGYRVTAMDLDPAMIDRAKKLGDHPNLEFMEGDMLNLDGFGHYDAILLFGDSLNYLSNLYEVRRFIFEAFKHLNLGGYLLFDMHSANRFEEFKNEYVEEGFLEDVPYQWSIMSEEPDKIHHHFAFYAQTQSPRIFAFTQTVFEFDMIKKILEEFTSSIEVRYDFKQMNLNDAEKVFFAARKEVL